MQISRSSKIVNAFFGVMVIFSISACYEDVEGCLDPNASNYDLTADITCEDCCTYPTLSLTVANFFDQESYNRRDTVSNDIQLDFVVEDIQSYFSKISVSDGTENFGIEETFFYNDSNGDSQEIIDDIVLAKSNTFRYTLGTFIESNDFTSISLTLGVPNELDEALSFSVDSDHPLALAGDSLYIEDQNQYVKSWIVLRQIGVHEVADTLQIAMPSHDFVFDNLEIGQERGSSLDLNIKIDYQVLIQGLDYNTMTIDQIKERLGNNLIQAISPNI